MKRPNLRHLTHKLLLGQGAFFLALGLALFVPAGNLGFWQGQLFFGLYLTAQLGISLYFLAVDPAFLERRIMKTEDEAAQKWISRLAGILTPLSWAVAGLDHRLHWSALSMVWVLLGDLGFLLGFGVVFWVFLENRYASHTVTLNKGQKTISGGPYAFVRHPMYTGTCLMFLASPLALGSVWAFIFVPLLIVLLGLRAMNEEKFLVKRLPGYRAYLKKMRWRLVPGVW